jgi:hypothetical protein
VVRSQSEEQLIKELPEFKRKVEEALKSRTQEEALEIYRKIVGDTTFNSFEEIREKELLAIKYLGMLEIIGDV